MGLPLRITVIPKSGESLNSVLARAAHANDQEGVGRFLGLVDLGTLRPEYVAFTKLNFADALAELLSINPSALRALFHPTFARESQTKLIDWYGTPLPRYLIETEVRRYSPSSLRRAGYHRAQWMIRPLEFCCESLEFLESSCPRCGVTLGWRKTWGITVCEHCGGSLQHHSGERVSPQDRADAVAAAQLLSPLPQKRWRGLQLLPAPFCTWEGGDAFLAVLGLAAIFRGERFGELSPPSKRGSARLSKVPTADLVIGYRILHGWPDSIAGILHGWSGNWFVSKVDEGSDDRQNMLAFFLRGIRSRTAQLPTAAVRQLVLAKLPDLSLAHGIPFKRSHPAEKAALANMNLISGTEASKKYAMDKKTIARLRDGGHCVRATLNIRRGVTLFDADRLERSIRILRASLRETEVCRMTGALPYCLGTLADRGLLVPVSDHDALLMAGTRLYEFASVHQLRQRLLEIPVRAEKRTRCVDVLRGQFHPESGARAIEALLDGRLHLVRRDDNNLPILKRCWVDEAAAREFANAIRPDSPPEGTVSCAGAGRILGLHEVYVDSAFLIGFIQGKRVTSRLALVTLESLLAFDRSFVCGKELAGLLSIPPRTVSKRLRTLDIRPRATLYKMLMWDRADAEILIQRMMPDIGG